MATTDSGTETLFSDDSPCDLRILSPSICSGDETETQIEDNQSVNSRVAPPNIQPFSGVLEKGKVVIRPIAFKPTNSGMMTPSARFGERYGSTPILTRPGSRLTLHGSTSDLHQQPSNHSNYSLDRKLRSLCPSVTSSSPLAMSSLPSLPNSHKLVNYDSLESVRKSPLSSNDCALINKQSYRLSMSNGGSLLDLTPSPSDSGVSELEAALRDRDSELAYLRQTMEHNEQVIFRVYQEKEKVWERELRRLKTLHDHRLRASAQKAMKLEQMLMMQSYQLNQDKKRLLGDVQRGNFQVDKLKQEVTVLRSRLEETEWGLCQKTGEISLLKTQLKEFQSEQTSKCQELLQLRTDLRELQQDLEDCEIELNKEKTSNLEKDCTIKDLRSEIEDLKKKNDSHYAYYYASNESLNKELSETARLKAEIKELREELSDISLNDYSDVQPGRVLRAQNTNVSIKNNNNLVDNEILSIEDIEIQKLNGEYIENIYTNNSQVVEKLRKELNSTSKEFEKERITWAQEKEKVLRYQRQLQMNYVQMYRRAKGLEEQLQSLSRDFEVLNNCKSSLSQGRDNGQVNQNVEL